MHRLLRSLALLTILLGALASAPAALAQHDGPATPLDGVAFEQRLGEQLPRDAAFVDHEGRPVALGDYFGPRPVVLIMGYYECPMLCSLVRQGAVEAIAGLPLDVGRDFDVVSISIDPLETTMAAANARAATVAGYGRPGSESGWHFLTGPQESIDRVADAIGFQYVYDETIDQYAHAAGIVVLTPAGLVSRYFYGVEFNPSDLRLGLVESSNNTIGSVVDQLLLFCYQYDPVTGRYNGLVMTLVRTAGVLTVIGLGLMIFFLSRGDSGRGDGRGTAGPAPAAG